MINDDLLNLIETTLKIKLPEYYKDIVKKYPFENEEKYSNLRIALNDDIN